MHFKQKNHNEQLEKIFQAHVTSLYCLNICMQFIYRDENDKNEMRTEITRNANRFNQAIKVRRG